MRIWLTLVMGAMLLTPRTGAAHNDHLGHVHPQVTAFENGFEVTYVDNNAGRRCFRFRTDRRGRRQKGSASEVPCAGRDDQKNDSPSCRTADDLTTGRVRIGSTGQVVVASGEKHLRLSTCAPGTAVPARVLELGPAAWTMLPVASNLVVHDDHVLIAWVTPDGQLRLAGWDPRKPPDTAGQTVIEEKTSTNTAIHLAVNEDDLLIAWHEFAPAAGRANIRLEHRKLPL